MQIFPAYAGFTLYLISTLLFPQNLTAQDENFADKVGFGMAVEAGLPFRGFAENYETGFGGNVFAILEIQKAVRLAASAGYLHFPGISAEDEYFIYDVPDWEALPVRLGAKYFLAPWFFLKAETGAVFFLEPGRGTAFILSPGLGLHWKAFEISGKFETWTNGGTVSFTGLSLGYFF